MKTDNKVILLTIIFFLTLITLPLLQSIFHVFPETHLNGITKLLSKPQISIKSWFNGIWQKETEAWFEQRLGFRGYLIKTDNYLNFLLFKESHQKTANKIIVGKKNYLYENSYIQSYLGRDRQAEDKLEARIKDLKEMQNVLRKHGIATIFLISPSKASFYPEYIPPELIFKTAEANQITNYEQIIPMLKKYEIDYIDGRDMLLKFKRFSKYPLFSKSGTHWTRYGSCLVAKQIFERASLLENKKFYSPNCNNIVIYPVPLDEDKDLADLINLWDNKIFFQTLAYPKSVGPEQTPNDINLLIVGDSFVWSFLNNIIAGELTKSFDFYYYFNTNYRSDNSINPIDSTDKAALKQTILRHDLIVIEANETALGDVGFGFIQETLQALESN